MNNNEKILELLDKKNLSEEEKSLLKLLMENDPEAKKIYDTYTKLNLTLKQKHISFDDLGNYILFKNNIEPENKDIIKLIPEIENHLKSCEKCLNEFKTLNEEYSEMELLVSNELSGGTLPIKEKIFLTKNQPERSFPVYAFASIILVGIIYITLFFVTSPANYELASISDKTEYYITRGRATDDFQESINALEKNDFDNAIGLLQNDINKNPNDETIFYSHYILGLSYMEKAENSFLGLFKSFNKTDAQNGLENLKLCVEKNTSGKFPDITYNAYFYSAKASIMLGDIESAKEYLKIVIDEKGSKMSEARNILNELE